MALTATLALTVSGTLTKDDLVSVVSDPISSGSYSFPAMNFDLTTGTGAAQSNVWHRSLRTLAASTGESIDLYGSLLDPFGATISFSRITGVLVSIVDPDGTKTLLMGPQSVANYWSGPWAASTDSVNVKYWQAFVNPSAAGWAVTSGTADILRISNSSATSVQYVLWVVGS
jgi:hypothetical protein